MPSAGWPLVLVATQLSFGGETNRLFAKPAASRSFQSRAPKGAPKDALQTPILQRRANAVGTIVCYVFTLQAICCVHFRPHSPTIQFRITRSEQPAYAAIFVLYYTTPRMGITKCFKIAPRASSTAAELTGVREAARYTVQQSPAKWTLFCDSKPAIELISNCMRQGIAYSPLVCDTMNMLTEASQSGHTVALQWIPSHCGIAAAGTSRLTQKQ